MTSHAIITGGSSGIGLAVAKQLAAQGMSLTLIARDEQRLAQALAELRRLPARPGQQFASLSADVGVKSQIDAAIHTAIERLGPPDLLITSAGMARPGYFEDLADDVFERTMRINYFGTLYAIQAALPSMRRRKQGRVVMVSSTAGLIGVFGYTAYSPTKFALRGLAEALRGEVSRDGVGISVVYPPDTDTPQLEEENKTKPEETKRISAAAATWNADDVAKLIVRGIRANKFSITPGWETTVLHRLSSLINPLLGWHFDRVARSVDAT